MTSSPYINRFLQPDTIIPDIYDPQNLNRFTYVLNNPTNHIDPTGHQLVIPVALTLVAIFAVGVWTVGHYTTTIGNPPFEGKRFNKGIRGLDWLNKVTTDPGVTYGNERPPVWPGIDCKKNAAWCVAAVLASLALTAASALLKCGVSAEGIDPDCSPAKSDSSNSSTSTATSTPIPPTSTSTATNTATFTPPPTATTTATSTPIIPQTITPEFPYKRRGGGLVE